MAETTTDSVTNVCRSGDITETVITAVAEAKGVDPLELEPLYTVVDPDALNHLFQPSIGCPQGSLEVRFSMDGCQVVVHCDGEVAVTPPAESDEDPATISSQ